MSTSRSLGIALVIALAACARGRPMPEAPMLPAAAAPAPAPSPKSDRCGLARALPKPLRVVAYLTGGRPALDALRRDLRALLDRYVAESSGGVSYEIVDAGKPSNAERVAASGLEPFDVQPEAPGAAPVHGVSGLVLEYDGRVERLKALAPSAAPVLELSIASRISELRALAEGRKRRVGVVTGHGEVPLGEPNLVPDGSGPDLRRILAEHFPLYELVDVDLARTPEGSLAGLDGLLVLQPSVDYTDAELRTIDAFTVRGKSLVVAASAVNLKAGDASMRASLSTHRLDALLRGYGVELRTDAAVDFGQSFDVLVYVSQGARRLRFPAILDVRDDPRFGGASRLLDPTFTPFLKIARVALPFASTLALRPDAQPAVPASGFRVRARTTPKALRLVTSEVDLGPLRKWSAPSDAELAQHAVAVTVEGRLQSAFADARRPGGPPPGSRPSRVLVIASSQLFYNPFVRAAGSSADGDTVRQFAMPYANEVLTNTILVAKATLEWMTMDDDLRACADALSAD